MSARDTLAAVRRTLEANRDTVVAAYATILIQHELAVDAHEAMLAAPGPFSASSLVNTIEGALQTAAMLEQDLDDVTDMTDELALVLGFEQWGGGRYRRA